MTGSDTISRNLGKTSANIIMIFVDGIIIIQLFNMINKDITILSSPKVLRWHQLGQHIGEIEA